MLLFFYVQFTNKEFYKQGIKPKHIRRLWRRELQNEYVKGKA